MGLPMAPTPASTLWYVFAADAISSLFRHAFPTGFYSTSLQDHTNYFPCSTENNNALVAGGTHRGQVANLEGKYRLVCTVGGLHTSGYVGRTTRKTRLCTPWMSTGGRASCCPRSDREVGLPDLNVQRTP
jgi:hypothetical protein